MNITPEQFRAFAPAASDATAHALFADVSCGQSHFAHTLEFHGLDAPHVAAQFWALCHLLSKGFQDFTKRSGERIEVQSPETWLWHQARWFSGNKDSDGRPTSQVFISDADEWEFDYLCLQAGVTNAHGNRLHGWQMLQSVCDALGVVNKLEINQGETPPKPLGGLYVDVRPDDFLSIGQTAALPHECAATN